MNKLIEEGKKYVMNTYNRLPIVLDHGKGSYVWDTEGNKYLDFVAGIAVNSLGHDSKVIKDAIQEQSEKLIHCSNLYWIEPQIQLAKILVEDSCCDKAFFCNSGAEANESAIKLARKWGKDRYEIISMKKSFHGRTLGSLAATGQEKYQKSFVPLIPGFKYVDFGDMECLKASISEKTCAIMLEVIQGEGGINTPEPEYLQEVAKLCKENNLLLIVDEVQTGIGRTGESFAYKNFGIEPDIISLAKALGGGVAIGAMLAKEDVATAFEPGDHASTFGGNPLATHVAVKVCEKIFDQQFLQEVKKKGKYFTDKLSELKDEFPFVKQTKGMGLMLGLDIDIDGGLVVQKMLDKKILINCIGGKTLRFVPPLNVEEKEIDEAIAALREVFKEVS